MNVPSQMVAKVRLANQYGQQVVQPADTVSAIFAKIAGTKTLTKPTIDAMKELGYRIEVVQDLPVVL